jgi:hypothetical protein
VILFHFEIRKPSEQEYEDKSPNLGKNHDIGNTLCNGTLSNRNTPNIIMRGAAMTKILIDSSTCGKC